MVTNDFNLIECDESHVQQICDIFNYEIINSTSLYEYKERSLEDVERWLKLKNEQGYPVIGIESSDGVLLGMGSFGQFRAWPAYKYTIEHSLYVHKSHRKKGIGRLILSALVKKAKDEKYHTMIAGIDSENIASLKMHEGFGFKQCGYLNQVGFKFDRWLNLVLCELIL